MAILSSYDYCRKINRVTLCVIQRLYSVRTNDLANHVTQLYVRNRFGHMDINYLVIAQNWHYAYRDKLTHFTTYKIRETLPH